MKKYGELIRRIIIVIVAAGLIWYRIPVTKNMSGTFYLWDQEQYMFEEGQQIHVDFNIKLQRYFFAPTELKGTISVDGTVYYSIYETDTIEHGSFIDKLRGNQPTPWFITSAYTSQNNCVFLHLIGKGLDKICMLVMKDGLNVYYGPARNVEEAEGLCREWSGEV